MTCTPRHRILLALALVSITIPPSSAPAQRRPWVGVGVAGGTVLGSQLFDHEFVLATGPVERRFSREVNLEDVAVLSAHGEVYLTPNIAVRGHAAWGGGRLQIRTAEAFDGTAETTFESDFGDVEVTAYDVGIGIWPWAPGSVGFAPFITAGLGTFVYDFDAGTADGLFRAEGERSNRAWLLGIGADMNVWRSITVRIEAINHIVDSPLEASDFNARLDGVSSESFSDRVNNIRLVVGAHFYFPFRSHSLPTAE